MHPDPTRPGLQTRPVPPDPTHASRPDPTHANRLWSLALWFVSFIARALRSSFDVILQPPGREVARTMGKCKCGVSRRRDGTCRNPSCDRYRESERGKNLLGQIKRKEEEPEVKSDSTQLDSPTECGSPPQPLIKKELRSPPTVCIPQVKQRRTQSQEERASTAVPQEVSRQLGRVSPMLFGTGEEANLLLFKLIKHCRGDAYRLLAAAVRLPDQEIVVTGAVQSKALLELAVAAAGLLSLAASFEGIGLPKKGLAQHFKVDIEEIIEAEVAWVNVVGASSVYR